MDDLSPIDQINSKSHSTTTPKAKQNLKKNRNDQAQQIHPTYDTNDYPPQTNKSKRIGSILFNSPTSKNNLIHHSPMKTSLQQRY